MTNSISRSNFCVSFFSLKVREVHVHMLIFCNLYRNMIMNNKIYIVGVINFLQIQYDMQAYIIIQWGIFVFGLLGTI